MMRPTAFFDIVSNYSLSELTERHLCLAFFSDKYPLFFSLELFKKIEAFTHLPVGVLQFSNELSLQQIIATLEVSFLGEKRYYAIKSSSSPVDLNAQATLAAYLQKYKGPHTIIFFSTVSFASTQKEILCIDMPKALSLQDYTKLYKWVHETDKSSHFSELLFKQKATLELEQALSLMRYDMVLGRSKEDFFMTYMPLLVKHEESLFTLSQHFFGLQPEKFFTVLAPLELVYPLEFWVAFWLEQIWQALIFIETAATQGPLVAKTSVSRLPFSFIQKDWKNFSSEFLIRAHAELYKFDHAFKNGVSETGLHIWYIDFLYTK